MNFFKNHIFGNISTNSRGGLLKINILSGVMLKGTSMVLNLLFVPVVLCYLTSYKYGVWLTINSVVSWFSTMDIGLAGGLRLKLQNTLSIRDWNTSQKYVSSAYSLLSLIAISFISIILGLILVIDFDFANLFNVRGIPNNELRNVVLITVVCFFLRFIFQPISIILAADQQEYLRSIMLLMENVWNLMGLLFLYFFVKQSLLYATILFSFTPIFNFYIFSVYLYRKKYKMIRPKLGAIYKECINPLFGVGIDVFITSISMIFIVQSNNILIANVFSPNEVTIYNIVLRPFGTLTAFYTLLVSPLWSAFGNAFANNDIQWVSNVFKKVRYLLLMMGLLYSMMIITGPFVIKIWTGMVINDYLLISLCGIYYLIQNMESTYVYLFNGSGQRKFIRLQRNMMIYGAIVNIPLFLFFTKSLNWGLFAVFVANFATLIPRAAIYIKKGNELLKKIS